jgi:hypothetical protein
VEGQHPASYTSVQPVAWSPERELRGRAPDRQVYHCPERTCPFASPSLRVLVGHVRAEHRPDGPPSFAPPSLPRGSGRHPQPPLPGAFAMSSGSADAIPPDLSAGTCVPGNHPEWLDGAWESGDPVLRQAAVHACGSCPVLAACTEWVLSKAGRTLTEPSIIAGLTMHARKIARRGRKESEPDPEPDPELEMRTCAREECGEKFSTRSQPGKRYCSEDCRKDERKRRGAA